MWLELSIFVAAIILYQPLRRLTMTVQQLLDAITALNASVDSLIALVQPPADLQPVADALATLQAKVTAATAPK